VYSGVWSLSCLSIYTVFVSTGLIYKAYSLVKSILYGKLCPFLFKKFVVLMVLTLWGLGAFQKLRKKTKGREGKTKQLGEKWPPRAGRGGLCPS